MLAVGFMLGMYVQSSCNNCDSKRNIVYQDNESKPPKAKEHDAVEGLKEIKKTFDSIERPSQDEIEKRIKQEQKIMRDSDSYTI